MCNNQKLRGRLELLEEQVEALAAGIKKELMTIDETGKEYNWSRRKIFHLRDQGILKFYRFPNTRRRYIKRSEVEASFVEDKLELS